MPKTKPDKMPETVRIPAEVQEKARHILEACPAWTSASDLFREALRIGIESKRLTG